MLIRPREDATATEEMDSAKTDVEGQMQCSRHLVSSPLLFDKFSETYGSPPHATDPNVPIDVTHIRQDKQKNIYK